MRQKVSDNHVDIVNQFKTIRKLTLDLCQSLQPEDFVLQTCDEASPIKWHLAHSTWFFENFVLGKYVPTYKPFNPHFGFLFNSYYEGVGEFFPRQDRGKLSRPSVGEIRDYRRHVDDACLTFFATLAEHPEHSKIADIVAIGLNHEQQHQELLLMDIKRHFSFNPLHPVYSLTTLEPSESFSSVSEWIPFKESICTIGINQGDQFTYDNERPAHKVFLQAFELADRLVTNSEYAKFIEHGGYKKSELWLSDGWNWVKRNQIEHPLYWQRSNNGWMEFTSHGLVEVDPSIPVSHVSYYEADACAKYYGARLPTEYEWEYAAIQCEGVNSPVDKQFLRLQHLHPRNAKALTAGIRQMFGFVWQWTASAYLPYPGYVPYGQELAEYNGKFMCNQMVLRGGSCYTPQDHFRPTYRNFFYPHDRWVMSGVRLARSLPAQ